MKAIGLTYPLEIEDAELCGRVIQALVRSGQLKSDDLHVLVEHGVVTLLGTVATPYERHKAELLARWVPGVRQVDNRLAVVLSHYISDAERRVLVETALAQHPLLGPHLVGDHVKSKAGARMTHGVVTLLGRVDNLEEAHAARETVEQVAGVREIVSALKIGRTGPTGEPEPLPDDLALLSAVNAAILDAGVTIYRNQSYVHNGVVHLHGLVKDRRAMRRALVAAQRVPGLQGIRNELALQADPESQDPDEALTGRVIEALAQDGRVSPSQVSPAAAGGMVVLSGEVDSAEDDEVARAVVARVPGVRDVIDDIRILGRSPWHASDRQHLEEQGPKRPWRKRHRERPRAQRFARLAPTTETL
jgi:osmotically-inducible protein OsmY